MPVTPDAAKAAYEQTGSVRKAGEVLGISGARVHQILKAHNLLGPRLSSADRKLLRVVVNLAHPVLRGAAPAEIADALGIKERALRYRTARLRKLNLVFVDRDGGYLATAEATASLSSHPNHVISSPLEDAS